MVIVAQRGEVAAELAVFGEQADHGEGSGGDSEKHPARNSIRGQGVGDSGGCKVGVGVDAEETGTAKEGARE